MIDVPESICGPMKQRLQAVGQFPQMIEVGRDPLLVALALKEFGIWFKLDGGWVGGQNWSMDIYDDTGLTTYLRTMQHFHPYETKNFTSSVQSLAGAILDVYEQAKAHYGVKE